MQSLVGSALAQAVAEPDQRHGDSEFEGILRALSSDSSCYEEETGNGSTACIADLKQQAIESGFGAVVRV